MSTQIDAEPAHEACEILLRRIERETDERKKALLVRDCMARANVLPEADRALLGARIAASFVPPDLRIAASGPQPGVVVPAPTGVSALSQRAPRKVDVLVTTVQPVEDYAARNAFALDGRQGSRQRDGRKYFELKLPCAPAERELSVVLTSIGEEGNVVAGQALTTMQQFYTADLYLLVGIAAGRWKSVSQGDLLTPFRVVSIAGGVSLPNAQLPQADPQTIPDRMRFLLNDYRPQHTDFYPQLRRALERLPREDMPPGITLDHRPRYVDKSIVAASDKLLRDRSLARLGGRNGIDRRIKLGDMESYGFATSVGRADWAVFRGASDYGDPRKNDDWQSFAATTAIVGAKDFIETTYEPPDVATL